MKVRLLILVFVLIVGWLLYERDAAEAEARKQAAAQGVRLKTDSRRTQPTDDPGIYRGHYPPSRERSEHLTDLDDLPGGLGGLADASNDQT